MCTSTRLEVLYQFLTQVDSISTLLIGVHPPFLQALGQVCRTPTLDAFGC